MAGRVNLIQQMLEAGGQSPARIADFMQGLSADPALAARLAGAAESGDYRSILKAMSEQQWGRAPAVPSPEAPAPTGSRSPMPFEQRIATDRGIRSVIEEAGIPPALRAGVEAGDPEAIMEAYRSAEDSIRALRRPPDQVAAESIAGQFDRALIPYGTRGPGVAGGMSGPGVPVRPGTALIPAPPRQIGGQTRALSIPQRGLTVVDEGIDPALQRFFDNMNSSPRSRAAFHARNAAAGIDGKKAAAAAAAAAGLGGAAYWASQNQNDVRPAATASELAGTEPQVSAPSVPAQIEEEEPAVETGGEADLAAETSPPPAVQPTTEVPESTVTQAPQDYSLQARALINRLNDMRRAAGGEVPEAPAMMREINRLIAMGNEQRRTPATFVPGDDASQMYKQAQMLIDQVNQMYRQGMTPNSPQVRQVMAQVRQLQAQGDAIRNRRAG